MYHWLKQCSTQNSVTETDISLIEFSSLISDVQQNRFNYILPPSVTRVCSIEKEEKKESEKTSKKSKLASMVKNNKLFEEWKLRRSENWSTVFRNKTLGGPMLSTQYRPCLKYHVKGICYDDYTQKKSHCELIEEDRKATDEYIKQLRGE